MSDYRKLPGHRRGVLKSASLWLAADHLLSVKSMRFREEYKRFYLRDIQGIVVADARRFHLSTRSFLIGFVWMVAFLFLRNREPWIPAVFYTAAFCLVVSWLWVSLAASCRCRIYTAVSREDLPSVYRTWTARRFLEQVSPRISEVQGVLQGDWATALEGRQLGPAAPAAPVLTPAGDYQLPPPAARSPRGPTRTIVSDLFVLSLFASAVFRYLTLQSAGKAVEWIGFGLLLVQVSGAVGIFVQQRRGQIDMAMRRLAITALVAIGVIFYARQVSAGVATGANKSLMPEASILTSSTTARILQEVDAGVALLLGIAGAVLSFRPSREPQ